MKPTTLDFLAHFEHAIKQSTLPTETALTSIAISLKRIADTLDGSAAGLSIHETVFGKVAP